MLTAAEVAATLSVTEREVRRLVAKKIISYYRFGRILRFDPVDVRAYQESTPGWHPTPYRQLRTLYRLWLRCPESERGPMPTILQPLVERRIRNTRMPPWASGAAIRAIYAEARRLTAETGVEHHVDHEIPLQGELVSGLHVETNLQILTAADNIRKKNRFEPC